MTVVPQQYRLHCTYSGWYNNFEWYYNNAQLNCSSQQFGYSCQIGLIKFLYGINSTKFHTLTVTWYAEKISSGIFSQSNNNGDHVHRCYVRAQNVETNHFLTVTGKYFYYNSYMMSPVPSDVDRYVVNVTSDTHTVTEQVKGGSQNKVTLKDLIPVTTYNITVRAYQDILGPASNAISVQTSSGIVMFIHYNYNMFVHCQVIFQLFYQSIGHFSHPLLNFKTLDIILIALQLLSMLLLMFTG